MRRVPDRRGCIVMADIFKWCINYCCIIDIFIRIEWCAFWKIFFCRLCPQYSLCAYLNICVAIEGNGNCESKTNPTSPLIRPCSHHSFGTGTVPERNRAPVFTPVPLRPVVPERADHLAMWSQWNGSGWLCGVNAQPDAFRSRLASPCVIMTNIQYILPKSVYPAKNPHRHVLWWIPRFWDSRRNIWPVCPIRTLFESFRFS